MCVLEGGTRWDSTGGVGREQQRNGDSGGTCTRAHGGCTVVRATKGDIQEPGGFEMKKDRIGM